MQEKETFTVLSFFGLNDTLNLYIYLLVVLVCVYFMSETVKERQDSIRYAFGITCF